MYIQLLRRKVCAAAGSDEILHEHLNRVVKFSVDIKQPTDVACAVLQGLDMHQDKPLDTSSDCRRAVAKMRRTVVRFFTINRQSREHRSRWGRGGSERPFAPNMIESLWVSCLSEPFTDN